MSAGRDRIVSMAPHLHPAQGWGGVAVSAYNLSRWLHDQGLLAGLLTTRSARIGSDITPDALAAEGLPDARTYRSLPGAFARRNGVAPGLVAGLVRALWRQRTRAYLLVHGVGTFPAAIGPIVAKALGVPYVIVAHGGLMHQYRRTFHDRRWKRFVYRTLVDPAVRSARLVVVTSEFERTSSQLPMNIEVLVLPNAVRVAQPVEPVASGVPLRLCVVGRISPEKGVLEFAREFVRVARPDELLVVAGAGSGPYRDALCELASSDTRVRTVGELSRDEMRGLLGASHFLVLPSMLGSSGVRENFGNVVAEALAHGRPVVVSRGMAWDEVERRGVGLLMGSTPSEIDEVFDGLRSVVADRERFERMCREAQEFARRVLSDDVYARLPASLGMGAAVRDEVG